jgi:hypothetical protein
MKNILGIVLGEDWGEYPKPHYDPDDECQCPDHKAIRKDRESEGIEMSNAEGWDEVYNSDDDCRPQECNEYYTCAQHSLDGKEHYYDVDESMEEWDNES